MDVQKILAIDADETLVINDPFPNIIGFVQDADYYIKKLFEEGYYIIIWTCRCDLNLDLLVDYLRKHNIPYNQINHHHPEVLQFYANDTRKICADIYIDDKNLQELPSWKEIYNIVKNKNILFPVLSFKHKTEKN